MLLRAALTISLFVLTLTSAAYGATFYTATTGNDNDPGTKDQPFRSIHRGVRDLKPGDKLTVRAGVYAESLDADIPSGESWAAPVTVTAYPGEKVTIKSSAGSNRVLEFRGPQHHIVVSGFVLDGGAVTYDCIKVTNATATGPAHHIRIENCEVFGANEQGVLVTGGANYNEFKNLKVHDCGLTGKPHKMALDHYHGFYLATDHNLVSGCDVYHNAGYGIHCYDDAKTTVNYNIIRNNCCYDNGVAGLSGAGIILSSGVGNAAFDNVVFSNAYGIAIDYSAVDTRVFNNTAYRNRKYGIYVGSGSRGAKIANNISYGNGWSPDVADDGSEASSFAANLAGVDPMFVDPAKRDFHLRPGSPAIGRGTAIAVPTAADSDTKTTERKSRKDLGAFERP